MIKIGPDYSKLKTNLQLASTRLHLLQRNKAEKNEKLKADIRNYVEKGKYMQARIKVQTIIKNDASIEAMELTEMYCKELSEKYKLFRQRKKPDSTLISAISNLIWVAPFLQTEIPEFKKIAKQLSMKYGPTFIKEVFKNTNEMVDPELTKRVTMSVLSDEKIENYLKKICFKYGIMYNNTIEDLNSKFQVDKRNKNKTSSMPNQKEEYAEQISKETEFSTDDNVKNDEDISKKKSFIDNLKTKFTKRPKTSSNKSACNTSKHKNFPSASAEKENYCMDSLGFFFNNDKNQLYKVEHNDSGTSCERYNQSDWKMREDSFTPTAPPSQVYIPVYHPMYPEPPPPYNYPSSNNATNKSNLNQIMNKCFDPSQFPSCCSENSDSANSSSEDDISINEQKKEKS